MFKFRAEKVHPSLGPLDDSSNSSSNEDAESQSGNDISNAADGPGSVSGSKKKYKCTNYSSIWEDLVEEFETQIQDSLGKCSLYRLEGVPLKKEVGNTGLHVLTDEIMKTYGLEFLNYLTEVITDAFVDQKMPMEKILKEFESLNFKMQKGKKLLIWIDDGPENSDPNLSFCRLLITDLLARGLEPDLLIPCNDLDEEVLLALLRTLNQTASPLEFQGELTQGLYKIGLSLALASGNCNLILIDADQGFYNVPAHHDFMTLAEDLGHQVLYLRHNPESTDKQKEVVVESMVKKVIAWRKGQEPLQPDIQNPPAAFTALQESKRPKKLKYLQLEESLRNSEILRKLTPEDFIIPEDDDSTDSEET